MRWCDTKVMFEPWRGVEYESGIGGHKVLILGESHYHDCDNDESCSNCANKTKRNTYHRSLTRTVVAGWCNSDRRSPLSYGVPKLFGLEISEFWPKVVFYNYVQALVGKKPKVPQKAELWAEEKNAEAFQSVINCFQPDRILVLGKKLWTNLPSNPTLLGGRRPRPEPKLRVSNDVGSYNQADQSCYWYESSAGTPAFAMPIIHPSAPGFKLAAWKQPVADWLSFGK